MSERKEIGVSGITSSQVVYAIIAVLLIVTTILLVYKFGLIDYFRNLPDFGSTEEGKQVIIEQASIPASEKFSFNKVYPTVRLYYSGWFSDNLISFRWNRNVTIDKVQVLVCLLNTAHSEWLTNPNLDEMFSKARGINSVEKDQIDYIMRSIDENNMIDRISQTSQYKSVDIDFPFPGQEAVNLQSRGYSAQLSKEEIKANLKRYYPEFYADEIKSDLEKGKPVTSSLFSVYFSKGINDLMLVQWSFNNNQPEIVIRPNGNQVLENGKEVWITKKEDIRKFLQRNNVEGKMYDTPDEPDIALIESIFDVKIPSELSQKLSAILNRDNSYTQTEAGINVESLDKLSINSWMYGVTNPDNLHKPQEETKQETGN